MQQFSVRTVDYGLDGERDLIATLVGHDAVLSLIGGTGQDTAQVALIHAAARARVRYFLPSEFCLDTRIGMNLLVSSYDVKRKIRDDLMVTGMRSIFIMCGFFTDTFLSADFGWDLDNHTVLVPGDGEELCSFIDKEDVAKYTVEVIKRAEAFMGEEWVKDLRFATATLSYNDLIQMGNEATGRELAVTYVSQEDAEHTLMRDFQRTSSGANSNVVQMQLTIMSGSAQLDTAGFALSNRLFPEVVPASVSSSLRATFARQ
ncbi:hypothetical protein EC988_004374 [Linderina pennispora]|nr:hypothetical protein EC988_004374 [Linderina pennispora]